MDGLVREVGLRDEIGVDGLSYLSRAIFLARLVHCSNIKHRHSYKKKYLELSALVLCQRQVSLQVSRTVAGTGWSCQPDRDLRKQLITPGFSLDFQLSY
jgi:hypothetical protein